MVEKTEITSDVPMGLEEKPLKVRKQNARKYLQSFNQKPDKSYPTFREFCTPDDHGVVEFLPGRVAQWLNKYEHFKTDMKSGIMYYGDDEKGVWSLNGEGFLQQILDKILGEKNRVAHYNNIYHCLKGCTLTNDIVFSQKIACLNGLLDVETGELSPFNLDEMAFHSIPTTFNPKAECPNWLEFLKQTLHPEDILTIQQWSGYILLPDYRFQKMMWLHGDGRNGKGVWQRTIEAVIGRQNVSGLGLEQFDGNHRFALNQLYGKLFNPCSEPIIGKKPLRTELLKMATGQDLISAERKGSDKRIDFTNTSKITILANRFPLVNDETIAFKDRPIVIEFPNSFIGEDQKVNLEKLWINDEEERSGILNWMLQGIHSLLSQGHFTTSKSQEEMLIEFERASDPKGAFIKECGKIGKEYVCTRADAKIAYDIYCEFYGLTIENEQEFTRRLETTPKISKRQIGGERGWRGITFTKISEDEKENDEAIQKTF